MSIGWSIITVNPGRFLDPGLPMAACGCYIPPTMNHPASIDSAFFSDLELPTSFFILRHGETVANADKRIQGRSEYSLNDTGRAQAVSLAEYLSGKKLRRLFHSPLSRAVETATIVGERLELAPEAEQSLIELDTGKFSDLTLEEIEARYPEEFSQFKHQSWEAVSDAERAIGLYLRAIEAWMVLKKAAIESGGNVAAISHGGTIQWLVRATFGCMTWMPLVSTGNCGVFELYVQPNGKGQPAYTHWKEINHLPGRELLRVAQVF